MFSNAQLEATAAGVLRAQDAAGVLMVILSKNDGAEIIGAFDENHPIDMPAQLRRLADRIEEGDGVPCGKHGQIFPANSPKPPDAEVPPEIANMVLHAWVGEDVFRGGMFGLKQGVRQDVEQDVPIPLVSVDLAKLDVLKQSFLEQVAKYKKPVYLCEFRFARVSRSIELP